MTRLTSQDIESICDDLFDYESALISKTGCTLRQIACRALNISENDIQDFAGQVRVGVVPVTSANGVLDGFGKTVASIVRHTGCLAYVTEASDVAGIAEAMSRRADIIMMADDKRFIALHMQSRRIIDNAVATAKGFVAGLDRLVGDIYGQKVLVMGCGPVGRSAVKALLKQACSVYIYDVNADSYNYLFNVIDKNSSIRLHVVNDLERALSKLDLIIDATPVRDVIHGRHINSQTYISVPGVPQGLTADAYTAIGNRLLHDPLQIGVTTMTVGAVMIHQNYLSQ